MAEIPLAASTKLNFKREMRPFQILCLASMLSFIGCPLYAQTTLATVTGKIQRNSQEPITGATIVIKNESTGFTTTSSTNARGEYVVKQVPLGKPYTIIVSYIGYGKQEKTGFSLNQGDQLTVDFELTENALEMDVVEVVANSLKKSIANLGSSTSVSSHDLTRLPVIGRNFTSLIDLSPLSSGNNLSGQIASSTNYTVDGMTSRGPLSGGSTNRGPISISMEAIREFEIATNQYDVTYGRAGGGTINTVTKEGTNTFTGSAFGFARADWLTSPYNIRGNRIDEEYSIYQYGFSLAGPIIKDKAHFFVAWDRQQDSRPLFIADIQTPADEARFNVSQSTLDRYLQIARDKYGVADSPQFGAFDKKRNTDAVFARIDWQLNSSNLLTIRNNFVRDVNNEGISDNSNINLYEVYGTHVSMDNSFLASLRSNISGSLTNELKLQHLYTLDDGRPSSQLPSQNIPRAIVQNVASEVNGNEVFTTIQLGGQRYLPETFKNNVLQLVDNVFWTKGNYEYTFGADLMYTHLSSLATSEMNGRFFFTGLDDFDNQRPYRYAREVSLVEDPTILQHLLNGGLYAQMKTRPAKGLDVMLGLRADQTYYFNKPNFNQDVFNELALRTDNGISAFQLQPRFQLTWDINERQTDIIRFGAGIFGSNLNNYTMVNNMLNDGTKVATVDVQNVAGQNIVPIPNFTEYRQNPSTAPGVELFNLDGVDRVSTINMNSEDIKVPTLYKANTSYTHFFSNRLRVTASYFLSLARNNYMYVDRNMVDQPYFALSNEGNRGVYVPSNTIATSNGATDWMQGRKSSEVGRVLELVSEGKIDHHAFVVDASYRYYKDGQFSVSYTWNDMKDNTSFNGNVANSATLSLMVKDDPRDLSRMTYSDNQFRNKIVFYGTLPTFYGVGIGIRYSGIGGNRYSLAVSGDINGDFVSSNDLAYIFDPSNTTLPEAVRTGIEGILNNPEADQGLKDYLMRNMGQIAERNGGINGFYGVWDLRISKRFRTFKSQYLELSGDIFNVANLLNKAWGVNENLGKTNLYTKRGFDAETNNYIYNVNANAGVANPSGNPYQIQIGLRYGF